MNINDYLIDQSEKDWTQLLSDWVPPLPSSFTVWLVNRFGDLFVVTDDDVVHMLDVGVGRFVPVAKDRSHFCTLLDADDNAEIWLLISLVDNCVAAGVTVSSNQCYGFKIPPVLGGKYEVVNIEPTDLSVHYSFLADIYRQTKDLPDGTKIKSVVIE